MIKKILIATDGSESAEKAASFAVDMASQLNCELFVISVVESDILAMELQDVYMDLRDTLLADLRQESQEAIDRIARIAKQKGIEIKGKVAEGKPAQEIIKTAQEENADLIMVGSHGKTGILSYVMGSVTAKLLNSKLTCPICVVQAG